MTPANVVAPAKGRLRDYVGIARLDHWTKNIFVLPGAAIGWVIDPLARPAQTAGALAIALVSTCLLASANYTINEYLDRHTDRFHPTKHTRAAAQGRLNGHLVLGQYLVLSAGGLGLAGLLNAHFVAAALTLLLMGLVYNVPPVRTKDRPYVDVLSESINNPIRLVLGWAAVSTIAMPPVSILISYWMGGAFLMGIKRYAEYRMIHDQKVAAAYRKSFAKYTESSLLSSSVFYAINSSFFLAIFLFKYKPEFLLSFPFFSLLFSWYLAMAMRPDPKAIRPESFYTETKFMLYTGALALLVSALFFSDIPIIQRLFEHSVTDDLRIE